MTAVDSICASIDPGGPRETEVPFGIILQMLFLRGWMRKYSLERIGASARAKEFASEAERP